MLSVETHRENQEASGEESYGRFLYNWHRTYDPATGRYLEGDPLGQAGGLNVFAYVESDPANSADPEGLQALAPAIPIPNIPAPPAVAWVGVAGVGGYWVGTKIEPYVSPIIWPYLEKLADGSADSADESIDEPDECDDRPDCDASYASDVSVCRAIGKRSKKRAALCYASAMNRRVACESGLPPSDWPPLITWNN